MKRCRHSLKGSPLDCSQCLRVPVRRITIENHVLCIDGVATDRQVDDERRQVTARKTARFRKRAL